MCRDPEPGGHGMAIASGPNILDTVYKSHAGIELTNGDLNVKNGSLTIPSGNLT